jgi:hypothetical protein
MARNTYGSLFKDLVSNNVRSNQYGPSLKTVSRGALVTFQYSFAKHDVYPLVILTNVSNNYISGLNLHYLTFNDIKFILQGSGINACRPDFNYQNVKSYKYIISAYRTYKRGGLKSLKILDCNLILNAMGSARALDPQESEAIRDNIKSQISNLVNTSVSDMIKKV